MPSRLDNVPRKSILPDREFDLPVDTEHKATVIKLFSFKQPHMRCFHLNWITFGVSFVSTFAPAALLPIIRESIDLTGPEGISSGIAAVAGNILARVVQGAICDVLGPRLGMSLVMMISAPFVFAMALVGDPTWFILMRFGMGFGLASFVACQFWTVQMFSVNIVGLANATVAGWGNMGGGVTQLLMPVLYALFSRTILPFEAWRWTFFVPGFLHIFMSMMILLYSQDLPDGTYRKLHETGAVTADKGWPVMKNALLNYRTWVLVLVYAASFGVELTMNNILVTYLFDNFDIKLTFAGILAALFGLMNLFARSIGGQLSDFFASHFGMRGRLWIVWIVQTLEGVFCMAMGLATDSLALTLVLMLFFSLCVQASEGALFGVVPFVSKRSLGSIVGIVGAGGNLGSVITQLVLFRSANLTVAEGIFYMGVMIILTTLAIFLMWFPMWGGMLTSARKGASEEFYYLGEYTPSERASGVADNALRFANECKTQRTRGAKALSTVNEDVSEEGKDPGHV